MCGADHRGDLILSRIRLLVRIVVAENPTYRLEERIMIARPGLKTMLTNMLLLSRIHRKTYRETTAARIQSNLSKTEGSLSEGSDHGLLSMVHDGSEILTMDPKF